MPVRLRYFDNMNAFFGGNGYRIVDQSSVAEADITFKNAWGMSDEDLYTQTIKVRMPTINRASHSFCN